MHLEPLDLARLFTGAAVLAFGAFTDVFWRRAPDALWWLAGGAGAVLLALQLAAQPWPADGLFYLAMAAVFAGLMLLSYRIGVLAGGADAKALIALAVLVPFPLHLGAFPFVRSPLPGSFAALGDALLVFLVVPLTLLAWNLARGRARWPLLLLGFPMPVAEARRKHYWPMEYVKEGEVRTMLMPSRFTWEDQDWDALLAAGRKEVWVTPKVPFLVPLLLGFVGAALVGDLLGGLLFRLGA